MAIAEDASQPAAVHATTTSATTASFSPPANSLLVALVDADGQASAAESASLSDSGSHTWVNKARANTFSSPNIGGTAEVWECQLTTAPGSITVTASWTPTTNANGGDLVVRVLTGAATDQSTAATGTSGGHLVAPTVSVTTTQAGSRVYGACLDYTTNASLTANANTTSIDQFLDATHGDTWATFKGSADTTTPGATTFGFTNASADYNTAAVEILAAATAAAAIPLQGRRGRLTVPLRPRTRAASPPQAQALPPAQPPRRRWPSMAQRRGRPAAVVPPQVVVTPPAYPSAPVHRLRMVLGRIRGRSASPVPPQVVVPPPTYPPPAVRGRRFAVLIRRGWAASPPQGGTVPPPLLIRVRLRIGTLLRGRTRQPVPPQQITPTPPAYPLQGPHARRAALALRRSRQTGVIPPPAAAPVPGVAGTLTPSTTGAQFAPATAAAQLGPTTAGPTQATATAAAQIIPTTTGGDA